MADLENNGLPGRVWANGSGRPSRTSAFLVSSSSDFWFCSSWRESPWTFHAQLLGSILTRFGMNGILVLAMIPAIQSEPDRILSFPLASPAHRGDER
jgi:hypothetical protein